MMINPKKRNDKNVILEHMPQICEWVSLGYPLPSIHEVLKNEGVIRCGFANFKHYYYIFKREIAARQPTVSTKAVVPSAATEAVTKPSVATQSTTAEVNDTDESAMDKPKSNQPEQRKVKSAPIGAPDLEMQITLARMTFEENKNRRRKRRK